MLGRSIVMLDYLLWRLGQTSMRAAPGGPAHSPPTADTHSLRLEGLQQLFDHLGGVFIQQLLLLLLLRRQVDRQAVFDRLGIVVGGH